MAPRAAGGGQAPPAIPRSSTPRPRVSGSQPQAGFGERDAGERGAPDPLPPEFLPPEFLPPAFPQPQSLNHKGAGLHSSPPNLIPAQDTAAATAILATAMLAPTMLATATLTAEQLSHMLPDEPPILADLDQWTAPDSVIGELSPAAPTPRADSAGVEASPTPPPRETSLRPRVRDSAPSGRRVVRRRVRYRLRPWAKVASFAGAGVLLVALAAGGLGLWYAQSLSAEISGGEKAPLVAAARAELGTPPLPEPIEETTSDEPTTSDAALPYTPGAAETFLLMGADRRPGSGERYGRSDTIILVRLDPEQQFISMLSIPRDTLVDIPGYGENKINAAYSYGGPALAIKTVRENFNVRIDHFAVVDFTGFRRIVDTLGGIWLPIDRKYYHVNDGYSGNWSSIDVQAGYHRLSGTRALEFARHRYTDTDYHRAARQQLFLRELRHQIHQEDPVTLLKTMRPVAEAITSDVDSPRLWQQLIQDVIAVPSDRVVRIQLNGKGVSGGAWYFISTPEQRAQAIAIWSDPFAQGPDSNNAKTAKLGGRDVNVAAQPRLDYTTSVSLVDDGGEARRLADSLGGDLAPCVPQKRPSGFRWSSTSSRQYRQAGHNFLALSGSLSSSSSDAVLWSFSDWQDPPILRSPNEIRRVGGRELELWWEGAALRQVAMTVEGRRIWVANTLRADLKPSDLIAFAASCR